MCLKDDKSNFTNTSNKIKAMENKQNDANNSISLAEQVLKFPAQMDESVIAKEYVKKWMTQMRYGLFCEQLADDQLQYLLKRLKTCNAAGGLDYYTKKWLQIKGIRIHNILYNRHEEAPDTTHSQHSNVDGQHYSIKSALKDKAISYWKNIKQSFLSLMNQKEIQDSVDEETLPLNKKQK